VYLTVTAAYMDESFDPKRAGKARGFFVVAGVMGRGWAIFELERNWEKLLTQYGLDYFKASENALGKKQFSKFVKDPANISQEERALLDSISLDFINLIPLPVKLDSTHYLTCSGVAVLQEDFYEVTKDPHARAVLGDSPYRLAYDLAFVSSAWLMKQLGEGWGVSVVCDEHEVHSPLAPRAYHKLKEINPQAAEYLLSFTSIDEKKCRPVQAADAMVYEVRRALNTRHKIPGLADPDYRPQFRVLTGGQAIAYIAESRREQLEWIAAHHKPGEPFKLDELMNNQLGENIDLFGARKI
jgi:hypothetical protein